MDQELYKAAKEGDVSCLSGIDGRNIREEEAMGIQHGKFLNKTQHGNNNILHIAARAGRDTFVAEALRRFPFLSDQVNSQGDTPLLVAARFGHLQVVKTLADPNNELPMQDDDTATAVESGTNSRSSRRQRDVEEGLVDHPLEQATSPVIVVEPNSRNSRRQRDAEEVLVDLPRIQGTTVLHEALRNGHEKVARYLLKLDPKMATLVNGAGESPLFLAAESLFNSFMLDVLQSKQPYSTRGPDGLNVLHVARDCPGEIVSLLIEQKPALMRQLDDRGKAAIHHAVEAHCLNLLFRILKADASMALFPDVKGYTPLLRAASAGNWDFCKEILMRCPESIEARNHQGQNALHLGKVEISFIGFGGLKIPEMWELLNVGDDEGNTALHLAVKENQYEKALLLTSSASIDLGAVNKQGLTALDLCESDCERLTTKRELWFHLTRLGARRGRHPNEHMVPPRGPSQLQFPPEEDLKPYINTCALVAALIATLTFAAAFTMPGGYDTSPDNLGGPTLIKRAALRVFILLDSLAMCCSIAAVFILMDAMRAQQAALFRLMFTSGVLLKIALFSTLVAFMSGMFAVLAPKASWVAILVCLVCSIYPYVLIAGSSQSAQVLGTWFIPALPGDLRPIQWKLQREYKKIREQSHVQSRIRRRFPDTT